MCCGILFTIIKDWLIMLILVDDVNKKTKQDVLFAQNAVFEKGSCLMTYDYYYKSEALFLSQ